MTTNISVDDIAWIFGIKARNMYNAKQKIQNIYINTFSYCSLYSKILFLSSE